ncbi:MAG: amidase family protein [Pseudomonadota bacterium]|nr:amidase family protein [Pseudomonadota bacterium]
MLLQRPELEDVKKLAGELGISLTDTEAHLFRIRILEHIEAMEQFQELRIEEDRPPLRRLERDPGYRPTASEDPLNVFIRKCHIQGPTGRPLSSKSVGLKDHIAVAGVPLTLGSRFMEGYVPDFDASIVTRLLDAGATIAGKMNMEDFSFGGPGFSGVGDFGRPLNPCNNAYVTGGSSSGSAAAVVAGEVDIAFGGDQGGSVRIPAAWTGCVGLMPTHGLVPHTGVFGLEATIDYVGPLTRDVESLASVMRCVAGRDGYDPRQSTVPAPLPDFDAALNQEIDGLRIGIVKEGFGIDGGETDVDDGTIEALAVLEKAGASLQEVSIPAHRTASLAILPLYLEGTKLLYDTNLAGAFSDTFYPSSIMAAFGRAKESHSHELPLNFKLNLISGTYAQRRYNGRFYAKANNVRPTIIRRFLDVFEDFDLLAMPTVPRKANAFEEPADYQEAIDQTLFGGKNGSDIQLIIANTAPYNYTGFPAIAFPCGTSGDLPLSTQLVAPYFRDDLLIRVAHKYQRLLT